MSTSNFGNQSLPSVVIITYSWILGVPYVLIIATPATYVDIYEGWIVVGYAVMASNLLSAIALSLPFDRTYKRELTSTQPNAFALGVILTFAWVLIPIDLVAWVSEKMFELRWRTAKLFGL